MKSAKKIFAVLLAAIMMLAMGAAAFAAADSYSYEIYQIFTGDYYEDDSNSVTLSNVKWGTNGTGATGEAVDDDALEALEKISSTTSDSEKLETILKYADLTNDSEPYKTATGTGTTVTISDLPDGYYLIKDVDGSLAGEDDSYTLYVVMVVGGEVTVTRKADVPSSQKKVKDTNDSTDTSTSDWQDSADWDIGDVIPFQLKATLPDNVSAYDTYKIIFHDVESEGLDFDSTSVKVYVDGEEVTSGFTVVTDPTDDCTFEVVIADVEAVGATDNSVITVEYTSTLNSSAKIGSAGNPNTVYLEYSNNPNATGEGSSDETGETPEDTVIVFTYQVVVDKTDEDGEALKGAGFTLYKWDADENDWVAVSGELTSSEMTTFTWKGIDDGTYKLVETTTPDGYNTMADIEFTVTAEHDILSDSPALSSLSGNVTTGEVVFSTKTDDGSLSTTVVNESGSLLPSTGGMGTTIFYVIGVILVIGAASIIVVRRRVRA